MLRIVVGDGDEVWDEEHERFLAADESVVLEMEHSLISLSKWESKFQKAFLGPTEKSDEEVFEYLRCMLLHDAPEDILQRLSQKNMQDINEYLNSKQSATIIGEMPQARTRGETITSELIYYWMVGFQIDWEAQYWHLNRLFTLIRICNIKSSKQKKVPKQTLADRYREINEDRKRKFGTRG